MGNLGEQPHSTGRSARSLAPPASVRLAGPADRPLVLEFLREMIPREDAARRYEWLYERNPAGRALTFLAVDDATGAAAGVTSLFPWRLWLEGREVLGALGGDAWVRPAFRRRGLGQLLHTASRRAMGAHGLRCMYGAPGPMNVGPLQSGGSRLLTSAVRWARPLGSRAFGVEAAAIDGLARRLLLPRRGVGHLEPLTPADDGRVDAVWAETRDELSLSAVRDGRFYRWRFLESPAGKQRAHVIVAGGRPIALCALEHLEGAVRIVDLLGPARAWGTALRTIVATVAGGGAEHHRPPLVDIRLLAPDAARRALWRYGFVPREAKPFLVMTPEGDDASPMLLARSWFFTGADSDLDVLDEGTEGAGAAP